MAWVQPASSAAGESPVDEGELTRRERLAWLEHRLGPSVATNVMVARFAIDGPVDHARFADAVGALVGEVEALRTCLAQPDTPRLRVLESARYRPPLLDLSQRADPDAALDAWLSERAPTPFALDRPLFEAALARLRDDRHVVVLRQHHMITDAESHALLWRRLTELYAGLPGEALRPMSEYRERERAYRGSDLAARDARHWAARLEGAPAAPTFYGRRPATRRGLTRRIEVALTEARQRRLERAIEETYALPSRDMARHLVYATALFSWLWRVTGQRRLAVGCPLANRRTRPDRRVVGMVMEQSPMIAELDAGASFRALFGTLRDELMDVLRHGRFCTRNPAHAKVYDAVLNVHRVRYAPLGDHPVRGSIAPAMSWAREWPAGVLDGGEAFSLTAYDADGTEMLAFDLNRDVFCGADADRAVAHFLRVLDATLEGPGGRPADVDLLTDEDRAVVAQPAPEPPPGRSFLDDIAAQTDRAPGRTAVVFGDREVTYEALFARAGGVAQALRERGVTEGDTVAVAMRRSPDLIAGLLGSMMAGAAYVPIDPTHPKARTELALEDARPTALVTDGSLSLALPTVRPADVRDAAPPTLRADPDRIAYVLFTSGSTGRPKGVEITHRGIGAFLRAMQHTPGLSADDRVLAIATHTFDISTFELFGPLMVGATVVLADEETARDGARLRARIEEERVTIVQATPPTWRMLVDAGWSGGIGVTAMCGGEPMAPDLAEALLRRVASLWNLYGPTETTVWCTAHRVHRVESPMPVGRPLEYAALRVIDDAGRAAPIGVEGEIAIVGAGLGPGYRGQPDRTAEVFVTDPLDPRARMYRSGDRGRFRPDGRLECLGRADGQIKIRGFRVELGEIEAVLRSCAGVTDAAVLLDGEGDAARLIAHVSAPEQLEASTLSAHATAHLPGYMVPARWTLHPDLPQTPTGKIDRRALRGIGAQTVASGERRVAPRNDTEVAIAGIWAEILDLPSVGVTDDFFDVGGQSLAAARIVDEVRRAFQIDLPLGAIFDARTVEGLAERVRDGGAVGPCEVATLVHGKRGVPLFCICGVNVYYPLASRLGGDRTIHGVHLSQEEDVLRQARAGRSAQLSVVAMAEAYTEVIRARQPHGPYALAGLSFGGLLAYEIARRLTEQDEEVQLVALFDTVIPRGVRRAPVRWLGAHLRAARRDPVGEARRLLRAVSGGEPGAVARDARERAYVTAMEQYEPRVYEGEVLLFRASESSFGEGTVATRDGGLGPFAPRMRMLDVPGRHIGMMHPPHVDVLAERLRPFLERVG